MLSWEQALYKPNENQTEHMVKILAHFSLFVLRILNNKCVILISIPKIVAKITPDTRKLDNVMYDANAVIEKPRTGNKKCK